MNATDLQNATAEDILAWTYRRFGRVALVASFQAESLVLIDLACRIVPEPEVLTLDTGRLHEETHDYIEYVRTQFPIRLRILAPEAEELEAMTSEHGDMLFRQSVPLRNQCCAVRKVNPLAKALREYDAWITGLRRDHSHTSCDAGRCERSGARRHDQSRAARGLESDQVWDYLRAQGIRHHPLYDRGYMSIGCAPCTRATQPGEQERAGRWWWESDTHKECLLHPPIELTGESQRETAPARRGAV